MIKSRDDVKGIRLYVEKNNRTAIKVYEALGMAKTIYDMYEISKPLANG
jgi:ribosomal protein S18 acetylase RimI-like enzyme